MRKITALFTAFCCCLCLVLPASATEFTSTNNVVDTFIDQISADDYYFSWINGSAHYGYDLHGSDFESIVAKLYYVHNGVKNVGYVIVETNSNSIIEFSRGKPAYDSIDLLLTNKNVKKLYINGMPALLQGDIYTGLSLSGEALYTINTKSNELLRYNPQEQSGNCIVGAISNLMWHWSINGYSSLASGMAFTDVEDLVDDIMLDEGGYTNANIPATIREYVDRKSNYSVTVTNQWNPSFANVSNETANRPCLLGFAAGSPYSEIYGHMTVCVGTRVGAIYTYVKVMDGWSTDIVEKKWGNYNDFMSKVRLSS